VVGRSPLEEGAWISITVTKIRPDVPAVKELLRNDREFLEPLIQATLQEVLEAEMTEVFEAEKGERSGEAWPSFGLLLTLLDHTDRKAEAEGSSGSEGSLLDGAVRTLSALRHRLPG
jgi:hypothetical protein